MHLQSSFANPDVRSPRNVTSQACDRREDRADVKFYVRKVLI